MRESLIPSLSSFNGPSYVLRAIEVLNALGVPETNVRLLPVIDHFAQREVVFYQDRLTREGASLEDIDLATLFVRLGINVRDDNRLGWLVPLVVAGLPPDGVSDGASADLPPEGSEELSAAERVRRWAVGHYAELHERVPDWTNQSPVVRLAAQLCTRFPELREQAPPDESATGYIRAGSFESDYRADPRAAVQPVIQQGPPADASSEGRAHSRLAEDLAELFFTRVFLAVACGDMLGGFDFDHGVQPEGRRISVTVDAESGIEAVAEWLNCYPHLTGLEPSSEVDAEAEQKVWEQYFRDHPERANLFVTAADQWTAEDPGVAAIHQEIRDQYRAGRAEEMTPDEMLSLARKHLPDYVPDYPQQRSVTGGLNLGGILLGLIHRWLEHGPFLGVTREDLQRFDPAQQVVLSALLLQRRQVYDYRALFLTAARLLIHRNIAVETEQLVHHPGPLGTALAQPGKTLALAGAAALHAPEAVVRIPFDRTRGEEAEDMEAKLNTIRRLFMPVHVPIRYEWGVNWIDLDRPTFPLDPSAVTEELWGDMTGYLKSRAAWMPAEDRPEETPS